MAGMAGGRGTRHCNRVTVAPGFQVARATPQATPQGTLLRGRTAVQFSDITYLLFRGKNIKMTGNHPKTYPNIV